MAKKKSNFWESVIAQKIDPKVEDAKRVKGGLVERSVGWWEVWCLLYVRIQYQLGGFVELALET